MVDHHARCVQLVKVKHDNFIIKDLIKCKRALIAFFFHVAVYFMLSDIISPTLLEISRVSRHFWGMSFYPEISRSTIFIDKSRTFLSRKIFQISHSTRCLY